MKRLLQRLWWILTLPVRVVVAPFRWLRDRYRDVHEFFTTEPEDVSITETIGEALESREGLFETFAGVGEHVDALRRSLLRSVIVIAIMTAVSFTFVDPLMEALARPLPGGVEGLQTIAPTEGIGTIMRVSLLAGLAFAMPWIIAEIYLFVAPGLMPKSRRSMALAIPVASVLFLAGMAFTYFVMLPPAVQFMFTLGDFQSAWRPEAYFGLVTSLMFWIGVSFQMPLLIYALAAVGLLKARQLVQQWRWAIVIIAVIAAVITPTIDPVNMALVMAPMILLYGLSILGAIVASAGRQRELAERAERLAEPRA
jgi:sec-independent protein translocase protein TatC